MPGWFETTIEITVPSTNPGCQPISITGDLTYKEFDAGGVPIASGPLPGMDITVSYNGTDLGTVQTQAPGGDYTMPADTYIVEAGDQTLKAFFAGSGVYPYAEITTIPPITITYCSSEQELPARFWISKWRVPGDIEADTYGGLLCIDPNGVRTTNQGPVIFLLDDLNFSPGLTEKSGVMRCQINDNATDDTHPEGRVDMELLREGTIWIQDDDEFWVGVQRGPDPGGSEPHGSWDPWGGGDGEGAGRQWLMGGYISKRYYRYGGNGGITAVIIGKDYMDVWKDQIFGTPSIPRNYTEATDIGIIAIQVVDDVNTFQPVGWQYTRHPTYFPGAQSNLTANYPAGAWQMRVEDASNFTFTITTGDPALLTDSNSQEIVRITHIDYVYNDLFFSLATSNAYTTADDAKIIQAEVGIEWKKEFDQEASDNVMVGICDEASYEWRIDYRRRVMLFPRTSAPLAPDIRFTTNIRNLPEIVMGDTTESITHVIVTDATITSIPPDIDAWCTNPDTWPDKTNSPRGYSAASMPAPANPVDNIYADPTLIYDDEVSPALCFQNELAPIFDLNLSIYRDASGEYQYGQLHLDLREWQKLRFRFRHPTRSEPVTGEVASNAPTSSVFKTDLSAVEDYYKDLTLHFTSGALADEISIITAYAQATKQITVSPAFSEAPSVTDDFIIEPGNTYRLQLHTGGEDLMGGEFFNNRYQYEFGKGTQGINVDFIDNNEWTEIELLLPEVDVNGNVTELNSWVAYPAWDRFHGTYVYPDPTDINWVSIYVSCIEDPPGHGPGQDLKADVIAGDQYLMVQYPEYFASSRTSTRKLFLLPNTYILEDAWDSEDVRIRGVGLDSIPSPDNLELDKVIIHPYKLARNARIYVKGGWTICFSQLHFERKLRYEPSAAAPTPPYRYRMMVAKEMENLNEAVARAEGIIVQEEGVMKTVRVFIDGDPRFEAGYSPQLYLNVDPFDNVSMFIDDIQFQLGADLDFKVTLTLGEGDRRTRELNEFSLLDAHDKQLRNLGIGRSKTRVDK